MVVVGSAATEVVVVVGSVVLVVGSTAGVVGAVTSEGGVEFGSTGSLTSSAPEHELTTMANAMPATIRAPRRRGV